MSPSRLSQSPWTDPRSLLSSLLFHALLLLLISFAAFGVNRPLSVPPSRVMNAEIGAVDNRLKSESGGGSAGEIGGTSETMRIGADGPSETGKKAIDAADQLLADTLKSTAPAATIEKAPIGPSTTGLGLLEGDGMGGGGGSGGGSGGGIGTGIGPGTEFFGAQDRAASFAFVIDCSGSMSSRGALRIAKKELLASLDRLPPDTRFTVVFYSVKATVFPDADGRMALMAATLDNKERVRTRLSTIHPDGGTDHLRALLTAIALKPEVIFFLTDAERMEPSDAELVRKELGTIRIQAIEFGDGPGVLSDSPLRNLATSSGGTLRHIDLSTWKGDPTTGAESKSR